MIPTTESVTVLAKRWAAGDRRAGSELVAKHDPWIRAYARRKALPWEDADDVAQVLRIAFVDSAVQASDKRCDRETRAYLRGGMALALANRRREASQRSDRVTDCSSDKPDLRGHWPEDAQIAAHDACCIIDRAALSEEERRIVLARCAEDLYQNEIAVELGCHPMSVGRKFAAAMSKIRGAAGCADLPVSHVAPARRWSPTNETDARVVAFIERCGTALGQELRDSLQLTSHAYLDSVMRLRKSGRIVASGSSMARAYTLATEPMAER